MSKRVFTMAAVQMVPRILDKEYNIYRSIEFLEKAVNKGADLIVLPELCTSGYNFRNIKEAFSLSEHIIEGATTKRWIEFAKKEKVRWLEP